MTPSFYIVPDRHGPNEPRVVKRRLTPCSLLMEPRREMLMQRRLKLVPSYPNPFFRSFSIYLFALFTVFVLFIFSILPKISALLTFLAVGAA